MADFPFMYRFIPAHIALLPSVVAGSSACTLVALLAFLYFSLSGVHPQQQFSQIGFVPIA